MDDLTEQQSKDKVLTDRRMEIKVLVATALNAAASLAYHACFDCTNPDPNINESIREALDEFFGSGDIFVDDILVPVARQYLTARHFPEGEDMHERLLAAGLITEERK